MSVAVLALVVLGQAAADTIVVRLAPEDRELTAIEELRLGSLDGPEETSFGWIDAIAVAGDGTMYVPDVQVPAIRVFDRNGRYLGDLGREGQGPGEYMALRGIDVLPGGEIAVWHEMGDITVFDTGHGFARRFNLGFGSIAGGPGPGLVTDVAGNLFIRTTAGPPPGAAPVICYAWVHVTAAGQLIDSIVPPDRDLDGSPFAFRGETFTAPSPLGYMVSGRTTTYAIDRLLADGRVARIERPWEPVPIEGDERAQWEAYVDALEDLRDQDFGSIYREKPAWKDLSIGYDGRVWVRRYAIAEQVPGYETRAARSPAQLPNVDWVEPARFDVVDPRGAYLGSVQLPPESTFLRARGDHVWTLERGEYDEAYVVRYRVEGLPIG